MARKAAQKKEKEQPQAADQQSKEQQEAMAQLQAQLAAAQEASKAQEMNAEKYKQSCQLLEEEKKTLDAQIKQLELTLVELTKSQQSPEDKLNEFQQLCQYNHKVIGELREKLAESEERAGNLKTEVKRLEQKIFQSNLDVIRSVESAKIESESRAKISNSVKEIEERTKKIILDQQATIAELENQNQHLISAARGLQENLQLANQAKEDLQAQLTALQAESIFNEKKVYSEMLNWKAQYESEQRERLKILEKQNPDDLNINLKETLTKTILEKETMINNLKNIQAEQEAAIASLNAQISQMAQEIAEKNMISEMVTRKIEDWRRDRAGQPLVDEKLVEELLQGYVTEKTLKEQARGKLEIFEKQIKEKLTVLKQKEEDYVSAKAKWDEKTMQIESTVKEMLTLKENNVDLQQKYSLIQQELMNTQLEAQTLKQQLLSSLSESNKLKNEMKLQERTIEKLKRNVQKKPKYRSFMVEERPLADESYREDNYDNLAYDKLSGVDLENNPSIIRSDFGEYHKEPSLRLGVSFFLEKHSGVAEADRQMDIEPEKSGQAVQNIDFFEGANDQAKSEEAGNPQPETLEPIPEEKANETSERVTSLENQSAAPENAAGNEQTENPIEQPAVQSGSNAEENKAEGTISENIGAGTESGDADKTNSKSPKESEKLETNQSEQGVMENQTHARELRPEDAMIEEEDEDDNLQTPKEQAPVQPDSANPKEINYHIESQKILEEIKIEDLSDGTSMMKRNESFGLSNYGKKLTGPQISHIRSGKMLHPEDISEEYEEMQEEEEEEKVNQTQGMEDESASEDEQEPENNPSFKDIQGLQHKNILLIKRLVELKSELKIMRLTLDQEKMRYDALAENKSTVVYLRINNGNQIPVNLSEEGIKELLESNRTLQAKFIELENENKGLKMAAKKLQQDIITCEANNQLLKLNAPSQALSTDFVPVEAVLQLKNQISTLQKEKEKAFYDVQQANKRCLEHEQEVRRIEAQLAKLTAENNAKTFFCQKLQEELSNKSNQNSIEADLAYLLKNEAKELQDSLSMTKEALKLRAQSENYMLLSQKKDQELDWYRANLKDMLNKDQKVLRSLAAEPVYNVPLEKLYGLLSRKEGENVSQILQAQQLILEQPQPEEIIKADQETQTMKDSSEEHPKAIKTPKKPKERVKYIVLGKKSKAGRPSVTKEESEHPLATENFNKEEVSKKQKKIVPPTSETRKTRLQKTAAKEIVEPIAQPVLEFANKIQEYEQKLAMSLREKFYLQEFIDQLQRLIDIKNRELNDTELELTKQLHTYSKENTTLRTKIQEFRTLRKVLLIKCEQKELIPDELCKDTMEFFKEINDQWLTDYERLKQENLSLSFKLKENKYENREKELALENEILRLKRSGDIAAQIDLEGQIKLLIKENHELRMKQHSQQIDGDGDKKSEFQEGENLLARLKENEDNIEESFQNKKVKKIEEEIIAEAQNALVAEP